MKQTTTTQNIKLRFWKKAMSVITIQALLIVTMGSISATNAQQQNFTFMGDYDRTFAAPNGYFVDPQDPDPTIDEYSTYFGSGAHLPDGSIIAGGWLLDANASRDFYLRKFTPAGALDTSFGANGLVRTNMVNRSDGAPSMDIPNVLKVQPDGKIILAGECLNIGGNTPATPEFGHDVCLARYNANGTLDQSFGGFPVTVTNQQLTMTYSIPIDPGKLILQSGIYASGHKFGTLGKFYDMAIQPDGKIVLVGTTLNFSGLFSPTGFGAIVVRLNTNGSLDTAFGSNGIARWNPSQGPVADCFPNRAFHGVRLQSDGRIIAVGYDESLAPSGCSYGTRFVVTRWTANGQFETVRHLDNITTYDGQGEGAAAILFTRDGNKILVSGAYRNLGGASPPNILTMVRLNLSDLSIDTTFANGGIRQHGAICGSGTCGFFSGGRLIVKAIQPDGKILAIDGGYSSGNLVRFNPDGSHDQSFGNASDNGALGRRGRLNVPVATHIFTVPLEVQDILVHPNGRINLIGYAQAHAGLNIIRAVVSQQNTVFENGVYSDFENDGKTDFSVFRDGVWYWLNSTNNQFNGVQFGIAGDKPAPADYDGDGKTDIAVFRDGTWHILRSSNGQASAIRFGTTDDLPRPGDFDGDGLADICVFRPSNGTWYITQSSNSQFIAVQFGANGDLPLLADFDGDSRSDISVYRNGIWYWLRSSDGGFEFAQLGTAEDVPVIGDYNGDNKSDPAVFRPSNGTWYTSLNPVTNYGAVQFGQDGDVPVPGDYDNDGKHDLAIYRDGSWYVLKSGDNQVVGVTFGIDTDTPIPAAYLP